MRSVVHVTMGVPEIVYGGINIPIGLMVSDDDADDDLPPNPAFSWMKTFIAHPTIAEGPEYIKEQARKLLEQHRLHYAGSGYHKIVAALEQFIDTTDLSLYNVGWFPDPQTATLH